ncbi:WavE lipopolysaccharide synthesis family protein [Cytophaga aurantiaca]|uniref:WavE lipopolysaccharide synthesis family protein n=1 Tax=Cytophaga aurantiaca TaxID=29530 RepID=UPI000374A888|nr:WavE lipopolysaccharide synthesis family protein [Cytophaga aurantiaca]
MTSTIKYSLLIQGPILSKGRSGKTYKDKVAEQTIVNYDCLPNIKELLKNYSHLFSEVVLTTWKDEVLAEEELSAYPCKIVKLDNPTPEILLSEKVKFPTDINNKYKQFYSCLKGVEAFDASKCDYVVKVRTDQFFNINDLIEEHRTFLKSSGSDVSHKLFVPFINKQKYLVNDFYFIGSYDVLRSVSKSMLAFNYFEFNSSVHLEISLKHSYLNYFKELNVNTRDYFVNTLDVNYSFQGNKIRNFLTAEFYQCFSSNVYGTLYWRGEKIVVEDQYENTLAFNENFNTLFVREDLNVNKISFLNQIKYIQLSRYLSFKYRDKDSLPVYIRLWIFSYNSLLKFYLKKIKRQ